MRFCRSLESDYTGLLRQGGLFQKIVLNALHSLGIPSNKARSNLTGIKKEGGRKKFAEERQISGFNGCKQTQGLEAWPGIVVRDIKLWSHPVSGGQGAHRTRHKPHFLRKREPTNITSTCRPSSISLFVLHQLMGSFPSALRARGTVHFLKAAMPKAGF